MTDDDDIDYEADAQACVNHNIKGAITSAIQEYVNLENEKEAADARSKEIGGQLVEYKTRTLPQLLRDYGALAFTDEATGKVLEQELVVAGSLPKDLEKRKAILDYIKALDGGDLIKTKVIVEFGRGDEKIVQCLLDYLEQSEIAYDFTVVEDIHPQTLGAFGRELIRENREGFEPSKAGLYVTNIAEPHDPKKPKAKAIRSRSRK